MKNCIGCESEKPLGQFTLKSDGNRSSRCNPCRARKNKERTEEIRQEVAGSLTEKICWRCKIVLPIEQFDWRSDRVKGRKASCIPCEDPAGTKRCARCHVVKSKAEFHYTQPSGGKYGHRQANCKPCDAIGLREWRLSQYGLTQQQYEELVADQSGRCAICGLEAELKIDHDHACCPGEKTCGNCRRQLLCDLCNRGLGMFRDNEQALLAAARYIQYFSKDR